MGISVCSECDQVVFENGEIDSFKLGFEKSMVVEGRKFE
jgi:hypothetical protein